jgi:hypothetical protein
MEQLTPLQRQISNRNYLSPTGFKFSLAKEPKVDFFSNSAPIPGINLGVAIQPTYLKDIPIPGDKLSYSDFSLRFIVDENMENYLLVHDWLRGFGYPESLEEYKELLDNDLYSPGRQTAVSGQSDGTLLIYNSNFKPVVSVTFSGMFPTSLSSLEFNSKDTNINYLEAEVVFKYTIYNIKKLS